MSTSPWPEPQELDVVSESVGLRISVARLTRKSNGSRSASAPLRVVTEPVPAHEEGG
jgi:hypothetical protein